MRLREVLAGAAVAEWIAEAGVEVSGLAYDNRAVEPGDLFFCVRGETADGHDFASAAVEAGAEALVVERPLDLEVAQAVVASSRAAMAPAAVALFGDPTAELRLAGITGTNGKTTTAFLVRHLLESAGIRAGLLGTVKRVVGGVSEDVERTTPEAIDLQRTFRRMLDAGDRACVMEVSSHALALHRTDGVRFAVAAFTNLTQDHLDFHAGMEDYFGAKRRLFDAPRRPGTAVINVDDPYGARLARELAGEGPPLITCSAAGGDAELRATDVSFDATGARFRCVSAEGDVEVRLRLPGEFNVANALGALAIARELGVPLEAGAAAVGEADRVPGRMEPIEEGQAFAVLVDYAHTPDSVENVLRATRRLTDGRLIAVIGAGGDRDREKRPLMGAAAARLADVAIVTSDNPRSEEPEAIIAEILAGMNGPGAVAEIEAEVDRRAAIAKALARARPGDAVVIAGKGHEQGQEFEDGRKIPFDDREVAREELRARSARAPRGTA
jgi:UDP-N-acetylmuramoyl-L-alanyl-D-glutamate--2,6-diaminopimelate ligase